MLPLLFAVAVYAAVHHSTIARALTARWIENGALIVATASPEACEAHRAQGKSWPRSLTPTAKPAQRRDHHHLNAELLACEGRLDKAEDFAATSLAAAEEARAMHYVGSIQDPSRWIEDELRLVEILRFRGDLTLQRGTFRLALQTLKRADRELALVREQLSQAAGKEDRDRLTLRIDAQREHILEQRGRIQTEMAAR